MVKKIAVAMGVVAVIVLTFSGLGWAQHGGGTPLTRLEVGLTRRQKVFNTAPGACQKLKTAWYQSTTSFANSRAGLTLSILKETPDIPTANEDWQRLKLRWRDRPSHDEPEIAYTDILPPCLL